MEEEEGPRRRARPMILPANYVTLRQLQEEKMNRKVREEEDRKRKEEEGAREQTIIKEEEEERMKQEEEGRNRKVENKAVKSECICKEVVEGEEEKPKPNSVRKKSKKKRRKGDNKREGEGLIGQVSFEEGGQAKGEMMKEATKGDSVSLLKSSRKNRKAETRTKSDFSREPVLCLTVDTKAEKEREDGRGTISSSSSSHGRDRKQRNMQSEREAEVTKAIGGLNLGGKGVAFVDGGVTGESKRSVSDGRNGGGGGRRGFGRLDRGHSMVWVKKSSV